MKTSENLAENIPFDGQQCPTCKTQSGSLCSESVENLSTRDSLQFSRRDSFQISTFLSVYDDHCSMQNKANSLGRVYQESTSCDAEDDNFTRPISRLNALVLTNSKTFFRKIAMDSIIRSLSLSLEVLRFVVESLKIESQQKASLCSRSLHFAVQRASQIRTSESEAGFQRTTEIPLRHSSSSKSSNGDLMRIQHASLSCCCTFERPAFAGCAVGSIIEHVWRVIGLSIEIQNTFWPFLMIKFRFLGPLSTRNSTYFSVQTKGNGQITKIVRVSTDFRQPFTRRVETLYQREAPAGRLRRKVPRASDC